MRVSTIAGEVAPFKGGESAWAQLRLDIDRLCGDGGTPLRLAVTELGGKAWHCEVERIESEDGEILPAVPSIFTARRRRWQRSGQFNTVMLVPTGIDCAVGGHAGDATPAARLLASVCDHLVLNPNVVNASDINEQTANSLYVEGSLITRLLMGSISLRKVSCNRILVVTEPRQDGTWIIDQVINSTSAARATLGIDCVKVAVLEQKLSMTMGTSPSGRSVGEIGGFRALFALLEAERPHYDAVALSTQIAPGADACALFADYFGGEGPNPWGGVEAALTHTVSTVFNVPSAHAPTLEDMALRTHAFGRVDPRKSAEAISTSYMFCLFKGLRQAPAVVTQPDSGFDPTLLAAEDISCLVIPAGCVGLPTLAALLQGITVIAVRGNSNLMKNDLRQLPFARGQLWEVENYLEAAGLIAALKAGIYPPSVLRPLAPTTVENLSLAPEDYQPLTHAQA